MTISARELIGILNSLPDDTPVFIMGADVRIVQSDEAGINLDESDNGTPGVLWSDD